MDHSPGPWTAEEHIPSYEDGGYPVWEVCGPGCWYDGNTYQGPHGEADAKLIADAPRLKAVNDKLLSALMAVGEWHKGGFKTPFSDVMAKVDEAIAYCDHKN